MTGCEAYNELCASGTVVEQCLDPGVAPNVLTTFQAKASIDVSRRSPLACAGLTALPPGPPQLLRLLCCGCPASSSPPCCVLPSLFDLGVHTRPAGRVHQPLHGRLPRLHLGGAHQLPQLPRGAEHPLQALRV